MAKHKKDALSLPPVQESWLNRTWRPTAAIVYLTICVFDFIIAPAWVGFHYASPGQLALAAKGLDPSVGAILVQAREQWDPITLRGGGLFHVAFGAILGVTAWTRGFAQIEMLRQRGESERSPYTGYFPYGSMQYPQQTYTPQYQGYSPMTQSYVPSTHQIESRQQPDNPDL